ncbi:MAG: hypothetical protein PHE53_09350 [Thermoguttaceae bacterium]|nr:hypothetical protein [Thermoguttaceae bacterium]
MRKQTQLGKYLPWILVFVATIGVSGCRQGSAGRQGAVVNNTPPSPAYAMMPQQGMVAGQAGMPQMMQQPLVLQQPTYAAAGQTICAPCGPSGSRVAAPRTSKYVNASDTGSNSTYMPEIAPAPQPGPTN